MPCSSAKGSKSPRVGMSTVIRNKACSAEALSCQTSRFSCHAPGVTQPRSFHENSSVICSNKEGVSCISLDNCGTARSIHAAHAIPSIQNFVRIRYPAKYALTCSSNSHPCLFSAGQCFQFQSKPPYASFYAVAHGWFVRLRYFLFINTASEVFICYWPPPHRRHPRSMSSFFPITYEDLMSSSFSNEPLVLELRLVWPGCSSSSQARIRRGSQGESKDVIWLDEVAD